jgi:membrane fusion protein, multidrug efflux system
MLLETRTFSHSTPLDDEGWIDFPAAPEPGVPLHIFLKGPTAPPRPRSIPAPMDAGDGIVSAQAAEPADEPRKSRRLRRPLLAAAVAVVLGLGGYFGHSWWTVGRFQVSTDDAYVGAHTATLAAKISGYVETIPVEDNQHVHAGDVIATIDAGDYQLAVDAARDKAATQQATIGRIGEQVAAQQSAVDQAKAQLASTQAGATRAQLELDRQQALAKQEFASRQKLEQAQADRDQTVAAVESAKAALQSAAANVDVLKGQQQEAARTLKELETSLAKAERDLSFTVIRAPFDGVVGNRAVQSGDYVQPGQRLASLVPLDEIYIDANFKETQIARLRPGQTVQVAVDAVPGRTFEGSVVSFAPASGSVFSLLPPDNATGNFTKIVQRVAVRIRLPAGVAREGVLRPGMSVVASIDTRPAAAHQQAAAVSAPSNKPAAIRMGAGPSEDMMLAE